MNCNPNSIRNRKKPVGSRSTHRFGSTGGHHWSWKRRFLVGLTEYHKGHLDWKREKAKNGGKKRMCSVKRIGPQSCYHHSAALAYPHQVSGGFLCRRLHGCTLPITCCPMNKRLGAINFRLIMPFWSDARAAWNFRISRARRVNKTEDLFYVTAI